MLCYTGGIKGTQDMSINEDSINVRIPRRLYNALQAEAKELDLTLTALVRIRLAETLVTTGADTDVL